MKLSSIDDNFTKGKIESVVKYAKYGFAEHRTFSDIESFNEDCIRWLARTGNAEKHGTTQKIPAEVFALEKEYLIPVSEYSFDAAINESISYQVRKDNTVLYKGNRYRVPKGTYSPGKKVLMLVDDEGIVSITDALTMEVYARYPVCVLRKIIVPGIGNKIPHFQKGKSPKSERDML